MIIYGIKNCNKVRSALKKAEQAGHDVCLHDFRVDGIDAQLVQAMLSDIDSNTLVNKRSTSYRQLDKDTQQNIGIETLVAHPTLIKRPVVFSEGRYQIGLPV